MLYYKAWLETRWRFVFTMVSTAALTWAPEFLGIPTQKSWMGLALGMALLNCFAALYLAGAGINSQTTYSAASGFHGSMFFTLSLPVSRRRLFYVRAGVGALETCIFVIMTTGLTFFLRPVPTGLGEAMRYGGRVIVCTMAVYALSTLLACILDEMWQFTGACLILAGVWLLQTRFALVSYLSPLRGVGLISSPTSAMPWELIFSSVLVSAVLLFSSVLILDRKEY
jgi:hypothetical protein